jgi:hypothetical protein
MAFDTQFPATHTIGIATFLPGPAAVSPPVGAVLYYNWATGHLELSENGAASTGFAHNAGWSVTGVTTAPLAPVTTVDLAATAVTASTNPTVTLGTGVLTLHGDVDWHNAANTATSNPTWDFGTSLSTFGGNICLSGAHPILYGREAATGHQSNLVDWDGTNLVLGEATDVATANLYASTTIEQHVGANIIVTSTTGEYHGADAITTPLQGQVVWGGTKFVAAGDNQDTRLTLSASADEAVAAILTLNGGADAAGNRFIVPSGKTMSLRISACAVCSSGEDVGKSAHWEMKVSIANVAGTTAIVGTHGALNFDGEHDEHAAWFPYTCSADDGGIKSMTLVPTASDANDCLVLTFHGHAKHGAGAANHFHVKARVTSSEVA